MSGSLDYIPAPNIPHIVLPEKVTKDIVNSPQHPLPYSVYTDNQSFLEGCAEQVSYVFRKLGGDVVDIELTPYAVFAHYQEACLEYSYRINLRHAKSILGNVLGGSTGKFDSEGNIIEGGDVEPNSHYEIKFPKLTISTARRYGELMSTESRVGGYERLYKTYIQTEPGKQEYDLQSLLLEQAKDPNSEFYDKIKEDSVNNKIVIRRVYFIPPRNIWRFFGFTMGGFNTMGNLHTYGMWADDSTYEVIPSWQNRLQAKLYEENMHVRVSHFSYELRGNILRIYPVPYNNLFDRIYFEFSLPVDPFEEGDIKSGIDGVSNLNNLPFENIPFDSINSIGKNWIRRYALALSKETLGYIRNKFGSIPFPNSPVNLNGDALLSDARSEMDKLREELDKILDETTYDQLMETEQKTFDSVTKIMSNTPFRIYVG